LDLFGRGFVLLRLRPDAPEGARLRAAASAAGMLLEVVDLDLPEVAAAYESHLVLVRPDGHVAWRADAEPADARAVIDVVRGARSYASVVRPRDNDNEARPAAHAAQSTGGQL
jgi:hypothetical protein